MCCTAPTADANRSEVLGAATLVYAAFMAVAIWRSAGNYRGRHAWRWLAKGSVLCVALQVIAGVAAG